MASSSKGFAKDSKAPSSRRTPKVISIRGRIGGRVGGLALWLEEGYCKYMAGEGTLSGQERLALIRSARDEDSGPFRHWLCRPIVRYCVRPFSQARVSTLI